MAKQSLGRFLVSRGALGLVFALALLHALLDVAPQLGLSSGVQSYLVAHAQEGTFEPPPFHLETPEQAYERQLANSKRTAAPTVWDIIVDINMRRYGRHPAQAECACATKDEIPKNYASWNVPTFPSSMQAMPETQRKIAEKFGVEPKDVMSFAELKTYITKAKAHRAEIEQEVALERQRAMEQRRQVLQAALQEEHARGFVPGSRAEPLSTVMKAIREAERAELQLVAEGHEPRSLSQGAFAEGLGEIVLEAYRTQGLTSEDEPAWAFTEAVAEQDSEYPGIIAAESAEGWSNDDLIQSLLERERAQLDAAEVMAARVRPQQDGLAAEEQEEMLQWQRSRRRSESDQNDYEAGSSAANAEEDSNGDASFIETATDYSAAFASGEELEKLVAMIQG